MSKLWEKGVETNKLVDNFTVGKDRELDLRILRFLILPLGMVIYMRQQVLEYFLLTCRIPDCHITGTGVV